MDRDQLRDRITNRVTHMLEQGLEAEVARLSTLYGWEVEAMKGIGYREWQDYFTGAQNLSQTCDKIIKASMDLAKRQRTWFKRNNGIQWLSDRSSVDEIVTTLLNKTI